MTAEATGERQMLKDTLAGINRLVVKFIYLDYLRSPRQLGEPRRYQSGPSPFAYENLYGPMRLQLSHALTEITDEGLKVVNGFSQYENLGLLNRYRTRFLFVREDSRSERSPELVAKAFQSFLDGTSWLIKIGMTSDGTLRIYFKSPRDLNASATPEDKDDEEVASAET